MTVEIPDLWSEAIRVDVRTPIMILRAQAGYLKRKTQGLVEAKLVQVKRGPTTRIHFDLVAGAAGPYRERLLTIEFENGRVYPLKIGSAGFHSEGPFFTAGPPGEDPNVRTAHTEEEFLQLLTTLFQSGKVLSAIQSMIARTNEVKARAAGEVGGEELETVEDIEAKDTNAPPDPLNDTSQEKGSSPE